MNAGDTDIEEPIDGVAHDFCRHTRFFGHRQIRSPCRRHEDRPTAGLNVLLAVRDGTSHRVIDSPGNFLLNPLERVFARAGHEECVPTRHDLDRNRSDLFGRFP
jgi:hypothetical protein